MPKVDNVPSIFKLTNARILPAILFAGLGACGYQSSNIRSDLKVDKQSYTAWCEKWDIACDASLGAVEGKSPFRSDKWDAITSVASEALNSSVLFSVTRSEFDSPDLLAGLEKLGMASELKQLKTSLDDSHWQSVSIEAKKFVSRTAGESSLITHLGLGIKADSTISLSPGADGVVQLEGLSLTSKTGEQASQLSRVSLGRGESLNLTFSDQIVQDVPFRFIEDNLNSAFKLEDSSPLSKEFSPQQIFGAAYPLLSWVNKPQRTASLTRRFFVLAENKLKPVLAGENSGPALLTLISAMDTFDFSASPGKNVLHFGQVNGSKLVCTMNGGMSKFMFDKDFGLKRFYKVDGGIGLEFYGIKASAKLALGIPLTLKRLEIKNNKITILDIPIIGKIELDMDKFIEADQETTVACSK